MTVDKGIFMNGSSHQLLVPGLGTRILVIVDKKLAGNVPTNMTGTDRAAAENIEPTRHGHLSHHIHVYFDLMHVKLSYLL